jgi:hypothetical protein
VCDNLGPANCDAVTSEKGRYTDTTFSHNGNFLAFVKRGGDALSGPEFAASTGVYIHNVDAPFGDGATVRSGSTLSVPIALTDSLLSQVRPRFVADDSALLLEGNRVVGYTAIDSEGQATGDIEYIVEGSDNVQFVTMSADMSCVAFLEELKAYVTCTASSFLNGTLTSRPDADLGVTLLSREGGHQLRWGEGNVLSWVLGATLYRMDVPAALEACPGAGQDQTTLDCLSPFITIRNLSVTVETSIPSEDTLLVLDNAKIVTMATGNEAEDTIQRGRVVIAGDRIQSVGTTASVSIPAGATVIDMQGGTVLPGFIDGHAHFSLTDKFAVQQSWQMLLNLAFGVTTLHNPSTNTLNHFADAELVRSGVKLAPRMYATGTIVFGEAGSFRTEINDMDDARAALQRLKEYGAFSVKSYFHPNRASRQRILKAAKELDMLVVPEGAINFFWNVNMLVDGHTTIEHNMPVEVLYDDVVQLWGRSGTVTIPTHVVSYGDLFGENEFYQKSEVYNISKMVTFHPERELQARSLRRDIVPDAEYSHKEVAETTTRVMRAGADACVGAHGQRQGIAFHWELWAFQEGVRARASGAVSGGC